MQNTPLGVPGLRACLLWKSSAKKGPMMDAVPSLTPALHTSMVQTLWTHACSCKGQPHERVEACNWSSRSRTLRVMPELSLRALVCAHRP